VNQSQNYDLFDLFDAEDGEHEELVADVRLIGSHVECFHDDVEVATGASSGPCDACASASARSDGRLREPTTWGERRRAGRNVKYRVRKTAPPGVGAPARRLTGNLDEQAARLPPL
jgi:hypothetical protein